MKKESECRIALGSDHGGYELKEHVYEYLNEKAYSVYNYGCYDTSRVDYPDYALKVGESLMKGEIDYGIIICGTGIGISIAANKIPGVRAALCNDIYSAEMAREHNNANILAMGGRIIGKNLSLRIVETFIATEFSYGRHERRIDKIMEIEEKYKKR